MPEKLISSIHQTLRKEDKVPIFVGKDSKSPLNFDWSIDDPDIELHADKKLQ